MSKDPIRWGGGDTDLYAYVGNNPVNRTDPTGLTVYACQEYNRDWAHYWWVWYGFSHAYLRTDEFAFGLNPVDGFFDPALILDESYNEPSPVECRSIPDVDEDCVNSYAQLGANWGDYGFSNNCGTFVADVLNSCRNLSVEYPGQGGTAPAPFPPPYPPGGF